MQMAEVWLVSGCGGLVVHSGGGGRGNRVRWVRVQEGERNGGWGAWWLRLEEGGLVPPVVRWWLLGHELWRIH